MYKSMYMFLMREKPETDDFVIKNYLVDIANKVLQVLQDSFTKISEHFFEYSCVSEHSKHF